MARIDLGRRARRRQQRDYDEFRETLAGAPPLVDYRADDTRTYRSPMSSAVYSPAERVVRAIAAVLNSIIGIRFLVSLFTTDTTNLAVQLVQNLTNWIVQPFASAFTAPGLFGSGVLDLPAVAAIVVVSLVAWVIGLVVRGTGEEVL